MRKLLGLIFVVAGMWLTGCDTMAPDGNATKFYMPFSGTQQNWPTSPNSFVTTCDGMTIYHGRPPRPYIILGKFDRGDIRPARLVKCARYYKATAIFLDEYSFNVLETDHGVVIGNDRFAMQTPDTTRIVQRTEGIPYLIRFVDDPVPPPTAVYSPANTGRH